MKAWARRVVVCGLVLMTCSAMAQTGKVPTKDATEINAAMDAFGTDLYNLDFASFGSLLTDDCDWINIVGMHWSGKAQVVKGHTSVFSTRYKGMVMQQMERSMREIAPGVVLVINKQSIGPDKAPDGKPISNVSLLMVVMLKRDGKWLIRSGENVIVDPVAAMHDPVK